MRNADITTGSCRSKSWEEFTRADTPPLLIVVTVCDDATETCPVFCSGTGNRPVTVHWGYPDPSNAQGGEDEKRRAFEMG